jgi:glucose-6-phosphate 1-dehydrogenase
MGLKPPLPQAVVIFGASGDLTRRKLLPAFFHLFHEGLLPEGFAVIGYARTPFTDDEFREHARAAVYEFGRCADMGEVWEAFARRLLYLRGEFADEGAFDGLVERLDEVDRTLGTDGGRFYYAAAPTAVYPQIVERIGESGMAEGARIVLEKPFGMDFESARELNAKVHEVFDESQIFRIDHYLGKETVQNILAFRFANGMFEPIWNRRYVDNVQITVAEEIGIEGRGAFYEQTGTLRDMVQTHLFQLLTFVAMEPPVSFEPNRLRDEKVRVLRSMHLMDPAAVVRGQYEGYRDEPNVAPDSEVETFVAMKLDVDNWRWAGVPMYLRTGKGMARKATEITLSFRRVPFNVFAGTDADPPPHDRLVFRVQPDEGISIHLNIKQPGYGFTFDRARMNFDYLTEYQTPLIEAYETLLLEAMEGDHTLFLREDEVERAWEVLTPVQEEPSPLVPYKRGSWGPEPVHDLILPHHWHLTPPPEPDADPAERGDQRHGRRD